MYDSFSGKVGTDELDGTKVCKGFDLCNYFLKKIFLSCTLIQAGIPCMRIAIAVSSCPFRAY